MARRFLTADDVRRAGSGELVVDERTVVTPQAREVAASLGVTIRTPQGSYSEPPPDRGPDAFQDAATPRFIAEPSDDLMDTGVIVTCVGCNRPGVLGEVCGVIGQHDGNINDVSQKMVGDYFHMVLVVELPSPDRFADLKAGLEQLGERVDYVIRVMHERVFRYMHRV